MNSGGNDPLLGDDWVPDPWDEPTTLAGDAVEEIPPGLDFLRGPVRNVVIVL
ncbi:MAG: hypothetical protein RL573_967, partial [Actinomycetota bacterium]